VQIDVLFRWSAEFRRLYPSVDLRHQRQSDVEAPNIAEAQQLCTIGRYWYLFKR